MPFPRPTSRRSALAWAPLLVAAGLPTAVAGESTGWLPLGRSEFGPWSERRAYTWREAQILDGPILGWAAAVDLADRVVVAAARQTAAGAVEIAVRTREADGWTNLPPALIVEPGGWPDGSKSMSMSMTTDAQDRPAVAWLRDGGNRGDDGLVGLAQWTGDRWTVAEQRAPAPNLQRVALAFEGGIAHMFLTQQGHQTIFDTPIGLPWGHPQSSPR